MKILFDKYPIDIILCMFWGVILVYLAIINYSGLIRIIVGIPFIIFIPGYILTFLLFHKKKTDRGIDTFERITLSFGFSMAIVAILTFLLNYTSAGILLESVLVTIFIFVIGVGFLDIYSWFKVSPNERFVLTINFPKIKTNFGLNKILTVFLIMSILFVSIIFIYMLINPRNEEEFTCFYLYDSDGGVANYPSTLAVGENATVKIALINHEYKTVNYVIEVWLIDQLTLDNKTIYNNMWFMDKINVTLSHYHKSIEKPFSLQWEYNYTFDLNRTGEDLKISFLLFTKPTKKFNIDEDYSYIAHQKINNAYRKTHLWIDII